MRLTKFILNDKVIKHDLRDLTITEIEGTKQMLSYIYKCNPQEIDVIFEERNYSDYDIGDEGMFHWKDLYPRFISGVKLNVKVGSDQHLDSILNNTIEKYLTFT